MFEVGKVKLLSNFIICCSFLYEKLEKHSLSPFWNHPGGLLARHSASKSETLSRLCRVNRWDMEHHMLLVMQQELCGCEFLSALNSTATCNRPNSARRESPVNLGQNDFTEGKRQI